MSESKSVSVRASGISTLSLLGVLFVGLKLTGHIDWSWFWVTAPFWGLLGIVVAICAVILVFGGLGLGLGWLLDADGRRRDRRRARKAVGW